MRKWIAVFLLLIMAVSSMPFAHADVELEFVFSFNRWADVFGVPKLPEPYGKSIYYCEETSLILSVSASAVQGRSEHPIVAVVALDDAKMSDFVMTATCILYTLEPKGDAVDQYGNLIKSFIEFNKLQGMMPVKAETKNGISIVFSKDEEGHYMFVAVKP